MVMKAELLRIKRRFALQHDQIVERYLRLTQQGALELERDRLKAPTTEVYSMLTTFSLCFMSTDSPLSRFF